MKKIFKTLFTVSVFSVSTLTMAAPQQPERCPSLDAIKSVPVNQASADGWLGWLGYRSRYQYDTRDSWTFAVVVGDAEDDADAIRIANSKIPTIDQMGGPILQENLWYCMYGSHGNGVGYAFTPSI